MSVSIIRFPSARRGGEGVRIGTVRRPPRGIRKSQWAKRDYFDVWYPLLAPSARLMRATRAAFARADPGCISAPIAKSELLRRLLLRR